MTPITEHFNFEEFACHDGTAVPTRYQGNLVLLCAALEVIRKEINFPISINSGYRTETYNRKIGGSPRSQHLTAKAADLRQGKIKPGALAQVIEKLIEAGRIPEGGLGIYDGFVHYDIRGKKSRWDFRTGR